MEMKYVTSSNIAQVGYDTGRHALRVLFRSGTIYEYNNVSAQIYDSLLQSKSIGNFFNVNIRNSYSYTRLK